MVNTRKRSPFVKIVLYLLAAVLLLGVIGRLVGTPRKNRPAAPTSADTTTAGRRISAAGIERVDNTRR